MAKGKGKTDSKGAAKKISAAEALNNHAKQIASSVSDQGFSDNSSLRKHVADAVNVLARVVDKAYQGDENKSRVFFENLLGKHNTGYVSGIDKLAGSVNNDANTAAAIVELIEQFRKIKTAKRGRVVASVLEETMQNFENAKQPKVHQYVEKLFSEYVIKPLEKSLGELGNDTIMNQIAKDFFEAIKSNPEDLLKKETLDLMLRQSIASFAKGAGKEDRVALQDILNNRGAGATAKQEFYDRASQFVEFLNGDRSISVTPAGKPSINQPGQKGFRIKDNKARSAALEEVADKADFMSRKVKQEQKNFDNRVKQTAQNMLDAGFFDFHNKLGETRDAMSNLNTLIAKSQSYMAKAGRLQELSKGKFPTGRGDKIFTVGRNGVILPVSEFRKNERAHGRPMLTKSESRIAEHRFHEDRHAENLGFEQVINGNLLTRSQMEELADTFERELDVLRARRDSAATRKQEALGPYKDISFEKAPGLFSMWRRDIQKNEALGKGGFKWFFGLAGREVWKGYTFKNSGSLLLAALFMTAMVSCFVAAGALSGGAGLLGGGAALWTAGGITSAVLGGGFALANVKSIGKTIKEWHGARGRFNRAQEEYAEADRSLKDMEKTVDTLREVAGHAHDIDKVRHNNKSLDETLSNEGLDAKSVFNNPVFFNIRDGIETMKNLIERDAGQEYSEKMGRKSIQFFQNKVLNDRANGDNEERTLS